VWRAMAAAPAELTWVFLDRDGTVNRKPARGEYVTRPDDVALLPGAAAAIRRLNKAGIGVAIVTNQRGVALGRMTSNDVDAVHARLASLLEADGARVDAIYTCLHEVGACDCRKPQPGLLLRAQRELDGVDFARAAMVGDSAIDVEAGRRVGARTVLISESPDDRSLADHVVPSLVAAGEVLLASR
jgi:D-glycero-D-manno-heptose 1,7-bisphosphate phosphatase